MAEIKTSVIVANTLSVEKGNNESAKIISTDFNLYLSDNLDQSKYFNKELVPNNIGSRVVTTTLVSGLSANIKAAHAQGYWNESDHIKFIIDMLQKQFVTDADVSVSDKHPLS